MLEQDFELGHKQNTHEPRASFIIMSADNIDSVRLGSRTVAVL